MINNKHYFDLSTVKMPEVLLCLLFYCSATPSQLALPDPVGETNLAFGHLYAQTLNSSREQKLKPTKSAIFN